MNASTKKKLFYGGIFLFFLTILFLTPISGDDWGNYIVGSKGMKFSFQNAISLYFSWEGRIVSRLIINFLTFHKMIWNFVNAFLITFLVFVINKFIKIKDRSIYLLVLFAILFMNIYTFSQSVTWIAGNVTYFFVIPFYLFYFYSLLYNERREKSKMFFFVLLNVFLTMFVEHVALAFVFGNLLILIYEFIRNKKINREIFCYTIFSILGSSFMILAPGSRSRLLVENLEFRSLSIIGKISYNIPNFIFYTFIINYYMIILACYHNYLIVKNKIHSLKLKIVLLLFLLVIPIFTIILYILSNLGIHILTFLIDQNNIFVCLYWLLFLVVNFLFFVLSFKDGLKSPIFLYFMAICANLFMLFSPTWGYRTSLFTYVLMAISYLQVINQYMKTTKRVFLALKGCLFLCSFVYLCLYFQVYRAERYLDKSIQTQLKNNEDVIEIIEFPHFIGCNLNPEADYHLERFREYYHIPSSKDIKIVSGYWKGIFFIR